VTTTNLRDATVPTTASNSALEPALRILMVEDVAADAALAERELHQADVSGTCVRVDTKEGFVRALREFVPDVVLTDHSLPSLGAPDVIRIVTRSRPGIPVILLTGALDERIVDCLNAGAADFVTKANLSRLGPAIRMALEIRAPLARLSPRQLEVLRRVAEGLPTRDIARQMGISIKTAEAHRGAVMKRLGIHNLAGLVRYAIRVGLVPPRTA
jgi:DNA-binding NarL/FixJ family response regulator